jgi:hypothetical protein
MDFDNAPLADLEAYLQSFGGFWAAVPRNLTSSIRELRQNELGRGEITDAIEQSRLQCYHHSIREFAKACHSVRSTTF